MNRILTQGSIIDQIEGKRLVDCASVRAFLTAQHTNVEPVFVKQMRKANRARPEEKEAREQTIR